MGRLPYIMDMRGDLALALDAGGEAHQAGGCASNWDELRRIDYFLSLVAVTGRWWKRKSWVRISEAYPLDGRAAGELEGGDQAP